ncbi:MAG TPA: GNAT family N-acetyltransferase [Longimicrobiales bacterium]|nr:GNAT family N-acetyltransferase [Longimicrobiales bacterium]
MVTIRVVTPEDVPLLVGLRTEFMREMRGPVRAAAEPPELLAEAAAAYFARAVPSGQYRGWFAVDAEGDVVAMVGCFFLERPPMETPVRLVEGRIVNVYTRPAWRGQGIARRLLEEAIAFARANDVRRLRLGATDAGRPLYESLGFRPVLTEMELPLGASPDAARRRKGGPPTDPRPKPDTWPMPGPGPGPGPWPTPDPRPKPDTWPSPDPRHPDRWPTPDPRRPKPDTWPNLGPRRSPGAGPG